MTNWSMPSPWPTRYSPSVSPPTSTTRPAQARPQTARPGRVASDHSAAPQSVKHSAAFELHLRKTGDEAAQRRNVEQPADGHEQSDDCGEYAAQPGDGLAACGPLGLIVLDHGPPLTPLF